MTITRLDEIFKADEERVILQTLGMNSQRTKNVLDRVMKLTNEKVDELISEIFKDFNDRHRNLKELLFNNYNKVSEFIEDHSSLSENRKLLIGAYFSKEYSIESAALFNPSIVPHPDQSGLAKGELRFILSLRATGEGHISSVEFREGIISNENNIKVLPPTRIATQPTKGNKLFSAEEISLLLDESELKTEAFKKLGKHFNLSDLLNNKMELASLLRDDQFRLLSDYTDSNYDVTFASDVPISERVLFPSSKMECMGMEDVRFVKFINDDDSKKYYGTYTAYNGRTFRSQLIETVDFLDFKIRTMNGAGVKDKGLALFPRKIKGSYYMISRQDGENLFIMKSDDLYNWNETEKLMSPETEWEFIQIGNCGSPIETEKGWLLITHAVGPIRKYVISTVLLDLDDPTKIIGRLDRPLITPNETEREGYVPNVVYSCGSLIKDGELIIPYAMSDSASGFAKVNIEELLNELIK